MKKLVAFCLVFATVFIIAAPALAASAPSGYTYQYTTSGSSYVDAHWDGIAEIISGFLVGGLPGGALTAVAIAVGSLTGNTLDSIRNTGRFKGYYTEEVWECDNPGIYPYIYWHKRTYYEDAAHRNLLQNGEVTWYEYAQLPSTPR